MRTRKKVRNLLKSIVCEKKDPIIKIVPIDETDSRAADIINDIIKHDKSINEKLNKIMEDVCTRICDNVLYGVEIR